jgi:hypothetical protein
MLDHRSTSSYILQSRGYSESILLQNLKGFVYQRQLDFLEKTNPRNFAKISQKIEKKISAKFFPLEIRSHA